MTTTRMFGLIALVALATTGCDIEFPNEEMNLAADGKTRPYAVVLEPLEAVPGDQVTATLHFYDPDPGSLAVDWRLALDYGEGLYETDEYERNIVAPDEVEPMVFDEHGYGTQVVRYTVPSDLLLTTSSQPDVIEDGLILAALEGYPLGEVVTRAEIDSLLATGTIEGLPHDEFLRLGYVADLFSCQIRLRGRMHGATTVDVTRNQTIRRSRDYLTVNVNTNPDFFDETLTIVKRADVEWEDIEQDDPDVVRMSLEREWNGTPIPVTVDARSDWTYYVSIHADLDDYASPFDPTLSITESYDLNWYHRDLDQPGSAHGLFVTDDGDPAEMADLDRWARITPPTSDAPRSFRIYCVSFDYRWEWDQYSSTPGSDVFAGEITFVPPSP